MFGLNPYAILGAIGFWAASMIGAGAFWGHHVSLGYRADLAAQSDEAHKKLDAADAKTRAVEGKYAELKDKVEIDYVKSRGDVDAAFNAGNRAGRLFDRGATCGPSRDSAVPRAAQPTGDPPVAAAGCQLSDAAGAFLREFAHDADLAAIYGQAGHGYATTITVKVP